MQLSEKRINAFADYLYSEEKSLATREKYLRDVQNFYKYIGNETITKELVISWKTYLIEKKYAIRSINSMLAGVNSLLDYLEIPQCKVKSIRMQRQTYCSEDRELTKEEYRRLLAASEKREQLNLIMKTICASGIRVSELKYFTVEAVTKGEVTVDCKSKTRNVFIFSKLRKVLLRYAKKHGITKGPIFVSRSGKPLNRSNIWAAMKSLCNAANVLPTKVFPHNLRKLFARTFYRMEKDIAKLADILGHSSINTTRIYIMSTGVEHRKKMERMQLIW